MATTTAPTAPDTMFGGAGAYLRDYAPEMADRVALTLEPRFDPEADTLCDQVLSLADEKLYRPYPAQAVTIQGLVEGFRLDDAMMLVGEMGTGKTPIGMMVAKVLRLIKEAGSGKPHPMKVAISCPNQLVDKWARHANAIMPDCKVHIVRDYRAVLPLRRPNRFPHRAGAMFAAGRVECPEVWIFPRDRSKLGYAWAPSVCEKKVAVPLQDKEAPFPGERVLVSRRTRMRYRFEKRLCCPRCGTVQTQPEKDEKTGLVSQIPADESHFEGRTKRLCVGDIVKADGTKVPCREPLWRAHGGTRWSDSRKSDKAHGTAGHEGARLRTPGVAPRRIAPSEMVHRFAGRYFDFYVADEVHELKGDTLQGQMFADLVGASERTLMMTGTLTGGYAENLRNLFWRTFPGRMVADGLAHSAAGADDFIRRYGVLQETRKWIAKFDTPSHTLGRGRPNSIRSKSLPGIAPTMFTNFLLPRTVFIRLMEMSDHLPPFEERLNTVPLTKPQASELARMAAEFENHREKLKSMGVPCRAWSGARAAFLRWPDKPHLAGTVWDYDENGSPTKAFDYRALPELFEYPKERRLRRRLCVDKARGIKSWVFTNMTGPGWDVTDRLVTYLAKFGVKAAVLRTEGDGGPNPMDREKWIAAHEGRYDVIISNPELVKTGLDLYAFTAIHFYACGENTYTLRQAARRHWRLGQLKKCRVDYYCYDSGVGALPVSQDNPRGDKTTTVKCLQVASMALMSRKLAASLALEGDFDENGLAALVGDGEDVASKLARIIAGEIAPDAKAEFAEYRRKLEASMPNLGGALPVDPPMPEPAENPVPVIAKPEAPRPSLVPTAPVVKLVKPGTAEAEAIVAHVTPAPVKERRPLVTNERELLESIVRRSAGANVRSCLHFGKRWAALFAAPPSQVKPSDLRDSLRMLRMLDKDGVLVFCVRGSASTGIGDCEAGMIGDVGHALTAITLQDWDKGIRVGRCEPLYALRD